MKKLFILGDVLGIYLLSISLKWLYEKRKEKVIYCRSWRKIIIINISDVLGLFFLYVFVLILIWE